MVHQSDSHLLGEAWVRGPVVLSWDDTSVAGEIDGSNLVIHEFAHKLDMQNGRANGYPPPAQEYVTQAVGRHLYGSLRGFFQALPAWADC